MKKIIKFSLFIACLISLIFIDGFNQKIKADTDPVKLYEGIYVELSSSTLYSSIDFENEYFYTFLDLANNASRVTELDKDIYELIKKRINGETVPQEIMDIDLNNYHRKFYIELKMPEYGDNINGLIYYMTRYFPEIIYCGPLELAYNNLEYDYIKREYIDCLNFAYIKVKSINNGLIYDGSDVSLIEFEVIKSFNDVLNYSSDLINSNNHMIVPRCIGINIAKNNEFICKLDTLINVEMDSNNVLAFDLSDMSKYQTLCPVVLGRLLITGAFDDYPEDIQDWLTSVESYYGCILPFNICLSGGFIDHYVYFLQPHDKVEYFECVVMTLNDLNEKQCYLDLGCAYYYRKCLHDYAINNPIN